MFFNCTAKKNEREKKTEEIKIRLKKSNLFIYSFGMKKKGKKIFPYLKLNHFFLFKKDFGKTKSFLLICSRHYVQYAFNDKNFFNNILSHFLLPLFPSPQKKQYKSENNRSILCFSPPSIFKKKKDFPV